MQYSAEQKASYDNLKHRMKAVVGQLNSGWPASQELLIDMIAHFNTHSGDASLIGRFYTDLSKGGHGTIAAAVKNASLKCAAIKFRKDENDANSYTAYVSKKDKIELGSMFEKELEALAKKDGLKSFRPKRNANGSKKQGSVKGFMSVLDDALLALAEKPGEEEFVSGVRDQLSSLLGKVAIECQKYEDIKLNMSFSKLVAKAKESGEPSTTSTTEASSSENERAVA